MTNRVSRGECENMKFHKNHGSAFSTFEEVPAIVERSTAPAQAESEEEVTFENAPATREQSTTSV